MSDTKVRHFGQMGRSSVVETLYDVRQIPELKIKNVQVVASEDKNVHLILIHESGEARIPLDAKSAKGLALLLTTTALELEPEIFIPR